jgi:hypothetical protein
MNRSVISAFVVAGVFVFAACDDTSESDVASATSTTVAASSTTGAPVELTPEQVATEFLEAYSAFDTDRALTYLTEDAAAWSAFRSVTGQWESPDDFRLEAALREAQGRKYIVTDCEPQGDSADGTAVRCSFDLHAIRSDEIGRGPYTDNSWEFVVSDGKITSAAETWAFIQNGFSAEMWQPFQAWVARTHPVDLQAMYVGGTGAVTEESVALWEEYTKEWVAEVNAGSA